MRSLNHVNMLAVVHSASYGYIVATDSIDGPHALLVAVLGLLAHFGFSRPPWVARMLPWQFFLLHCITSYPIELILTSCQILNHGHLSFLRSIGQPFALILSSSADKARHSKVFMEDPRVHGGQPSLNSVGEQGDDPMEGPQGTVTPHYDAHCGCEHIEISWVLPPNNHMVGMDWVMTLSRAHLGALQGLCCSGGWP